VGHRFRAGHEGALNAYKTLFLAGGADVKTVGTDFKQLDLKAVQGAGETRIAAAAGVPPVVVGLSEGLQAATYSNYAQARRRFADQTMRPLWRNAAGSLARIINVPPASELWYDDRDIPALREDEKDAADIQQSQAVTIRRAHQRRL
jgi:phage portal protein BeeE